MKALSIAGRKIGKGHPCYIIAEVSCNHEGSLDEAKAIIRAAGDAGCDAVKIQTYTADTMTRDFATKPKGTIWEKMDLYKLYQKAQTPWEWYDELNDAAIKSGLTLFSSPFDETAVDFLERKNVPAYKIASFEIVDIKLLEHVAATGKPVIMSSGMATKEELEEAYDTLKKHGTKDFAMLQCNSGYPGDFADANLATIPAMEEKFDCVVGLSDHIIFVDSQIDQCRQPLPHVTSLEAVKLGASVLEMHLMIDRDRARARMEKGEGGFDWPFSRTPDEMKKIVDLVRAYERGEDVSYKTDIEKQMAIKAQGEIMFHPTEKEKGSRNLRPSLWVVENIKAGEVLRFAGGRPGNVDSIRPGGGLHIRYADQIDGAHAARDIKAGEPLSWDMIQKIKTL